MVFNHSKIVFFVVAFMFVAISTQAGFLDMPDVIEVPEYEERTQRLDLDIPSVRDRDPDPLAGPRLNVKEFRIQGLVEYPKLGITREALIKKVEDIRFDYMEEGELLESGYTLNELGQISDLIGEIEETTEGEHVTSLEVQRLVFLIREQRRLRGITLGMIETVADTITHFYRERGFVLAKAYIPEQKVRDGVVVLTVLLGELGEVNLNNGKRYSKRKMEKIFGDVMGKPVFSSKIDEKLYLVNDMPGLSAQGYFQAGSQVGDTKLNINVLSETWYDANIRMDNHGSSSTGEYRLYADMQLHNPLKYGDQLQVSVLNSVEPENSTYYSLRYNAPFLSPKLKYSLGISTNDFVSGEGNKGSSIGNVEFSGESQVKDASFKYILTRSRIRNFSLDLAFAKISTKLNIGTAETGFTSEDIVNNVSLAFNFDVLEERSRRLHVGQAKVTYSENIPDEDIRNPSATDGSIKQQDK